MPTGGRICPISGEPPSGQWALRHMPYISVARGFGALRPDKQPYGLQGVGRLLKLGGFPPE